MNYFINPKAGSDSHPPGDPARPWKTFGPINLLHLSAGDLIDIQSAGEFRQSLVVRGCGSIEAPIRVRFAPGRYDFYPDDAQRRLFNISNTNSDPDGPKAIAILIDRSSHVRLEGAGARIVCRGKMIELCIDHSHDVEVSGLSFDYHRPTVSEFTVVDAQPGFADIAVHLDSTYQINAGRLTWVGEGWTCPPDGRRLLAQRLDRETGYLNRCPNPLASLTLEEQRPGQLRCTGDHTLRAGDVYQVRDTFRDCVGVFMNRSSDVRFRKLNFFFLHGMGVLCQFTRDILLDQVSIAPDPGSGRTTSAWADCLHCSGCAGLVVVQDCTFDGAHDDAINVHGTYLRVVGRPAEHEVRLRFMHDQTYGFAAFIAGDEVEFVRANTLQSYATHRVVNAVMINPRDMLLTLDRPAPVDIQDRDVVENVTWTPEVEIRRCTVKHIPTRGFLLTSRRRTVVENNRFIQTNMEGIHVGGDANNWFESGCVKDMTITGNLFDRCRRAGVVVKPVVEETDVIVHSNIRITGNRFVLQGGTDTITITQNAAVLMADNEIDRSTENRTHI